MSHDTNTGYPMGPDYFRNDPNTADTTPRGAAFPEDLSLPLYGASFGQAVKRFFKSFVRFSGRASRSEYWWAALFIGLIQLVPAILYINGTVQTLTVIAVDPYTGQINAPGEAATMMTLVGGILLFVTSLILLVPSLSLTWRRLHDANLAGAYWFLFFIPIVGPVILFVLTLLPSKPEGQRFDI